MKYFYWALGLACTLIAPDAWAAQDVVNTRHNLSTVTPVGVTRTFASTTVDEICVFCHTPHNSAAANPERLLAKNEEDTCYGCHDADGPGTDIQGDFANLRS